MDDWAPKWEQKTINTFKKWEKDGAEAIAIDFIELRKKEWMPPERLDKLICAITETLEQKVHDENTIREECEEALRKIKWKRTIWEIGTALTSDIIAQFDVIASSEEKIIEFRNGVNTPITIKNFEEGLKIKNITDINSFGFANYLLYLHKEDNLSSWKLESILGGTHIGKRKLQDLAILWGLDDPIKWTINTNTQKMLARESPTVLNIVRRILSDELREYLSWPKNGYVKEILKAKYWDKFKEEEFDFATKGEILDIRKLADYLKKLTGKNITNLRDLEELLGAHDKDVAEEERRIHIEKDMNNRERKSWKKQNILDNDKELSERKKRIGILWMESSAMKDPNVRSWMLNYVSWKISRKEFDKALDREIEKERKKRGFEKDGEYLQKPTPKREEKDGKATQKISPHKHVPISRLQDGESYSYDIGRRSSYINTATIRRENNQYVVQIGDNGENTISFSTKKETVMYMKSLRFLEQSGLGYLIRHLSQEDLFDVLRITSKDNTKVDNRDGTFDDDEKIRILRAFWGIFGIKNSIGIINAKDGWKIFQDFFRNHSVESILASKGIIENGTLQKERLKTAIKSPIEKDRKNTA